MKITALKRVARNVTDLAQAREFYTKALGFSALSPVTEDPELAALLRLQHVRALRLCLGDQEIELTECFPAGALHPYADGNAVDFQHIALLAPDIHAAYDKALQHGAEPISAEGPVQLPPSSGAVIAVKFRDPDGHPLEFIQKSATGYDHSAISVAGIRRSIAFYTELGLSLAAQQVNEGPEQAALDGIADPIVDVVTLNPLQSRPHVELLGYRTPKPIPVSYNAGDICADRLIFTCNEPGLHLLRDPDRHFIILEGDRK